MSEGMQKKGRSSGGRMDCPRRSLRALPYGWFIAVSLMFSGAYGCASYGASTPVAVRVDWNKTVGVSKTTATMMHMVHPVSRKGTFMHDKSIGAIRDLSARYVRYLNW